MITKQLINTSYTDNCSVLVASCEKYSDLWTPFFKLFLKYWSDCPFFVYLISNEKQFLYQKVQNIQVGPDKSWSDSMQVALRSLKSEYIIMFLDDFFLRKPVKTELILTLLKILMEIDGKMLRLVPRPGPDIRIKDFHEIGLIERGAPWRISTQIAIWRRDFLMEILRGGESIWEFEVRGSERSNKYADGLFCVWKPAIDYGHHVVERGKWFRDEARRFGYMGIGCDFTRREIMTRRESLIWNLRKLRGLTLDIIPWKQRLILLKFLRQVRGKK